MPLDCVVADHLMWGGCDLADDLGIPCIVNSASTFQNPFRGSFSQAEFKVVAPIGITSTLGRCYVYISNWLEKAAWCYRYFASNMIRQAFDIEAYPSPDRAFGFHRVTMVNVPVGVEPAKRLVTTQVHRIGHDLHIPSNLPDDIEHWLQEDPDSPVLFVSIVAHRLASWPASILAEADEQLALSVANLTPSGYRVLWGTGPDLSSSDILHTAMANLDIKVVALTTTAEELDIIYDPRISVLMSDGRISSLIGAVESATPVLCAPCCAAEYFHNCISTATAKAAIFVSAMFTQEHFGRFEELNLHDNQVNALRIGSSAAAAELVELVTLVGEHHFLPLDVVHLHWLFQQTYFDIWFVVFFLTLVVGWLSYATVKLSIAFGRYVWPIFLEALGEPEGKPKVKSD